MAHRHKVHKAAGGKITHEAEEIREEKEAGLKCGGAAKHKHGGKVHGAKAHHRLDKRARGGGVGSDKSPFSSAHIKGHMGAASNPHAHHLKHGGHASRGK